MDIYCHNIKFLADIWQLAYARLSKFVIGLFYCEGQICSIVRFYYPFLAGALDVRISSPKVLNILLISSSKLLHMKRTISVTAKSAVPGEVGEATGRFEVTGAGLGVGIRAPWG